MNNSKKRLKTFIVHSLIMLFSIMAIISTTVCVEVLAQTHTETAVGQILTKEKAEITKFAFIAAALAFGLGALGAGFAISHVGAAAMGAVAEKPEVATQALIFVALAEGIVVFGFITALMILFKV